MAAIDRAGMARVPRWLVADALADGRLQQVFQEPQTLGYELKAVWPQVRALPLKTRVVSDGLAERVPPLLAPP